jgi:hypothetical protein
MRSKFKIKDFVRVVAKLSLREAAAGDGLAKDIAVPSGNGGHVVQNGHVVLVQRKDEFASPAHGDKRRRGRRVHDSAFNAGGCRFCGPLRSEIDHHGLRNLRNKRGDHRGHVQDLVVRVRDVHELEDLPRIATTNRDGQWQLMLVTPEERWRTIYDFPSFSGHPDCTSGFVGDVEPDRAVVSACYTVGQGDTAATPCDGLDDVHCRADRLSSWDFSASVVLRFGQKTLEGTATYRQKLISIFVIDAGIPFTTVVGH